MFKNYFEKLKARKVARQLVQLPAIQIGRKAIEHYWTNLDEVTQDFSDGFVEDVATDMMEKVVAIATSSDPRMANREELVGWVFEYARFQVLVLEPPPEEDPTGYRGQSGITGELKARLFELAQKDKNLKEFMHGYDTPKNWDDVWNPVLMRYRVAFAWANVLQMLRFAFDDVNRAEGKDWFKPFVAAMCAWEEHHFRESLGLPYSLDNSGMGANLRSVMLSNLADCVLNGAQYPDLEWKRNIEKVEHPGIEDETP